MRCLNGILAVCLLLCVPLTYADALIDRSRVEDMPLQQQIGSGFE